MGNNSNILINLLKSSLFFLLLFPVFIYAQSLSVESVVVGNNDFKVFYSLDNVEEYKADNIQLQYCIDGRNFINCSGITIKNNLINWKPSSFEYDSIQFQVVAKLVKKENVSKELERTTERIDEIIKIIENSMIEIKKDSKLYKSNREITLKQYYLITGKYPITKHYKLKTINQNDCMDCPAMLTYEEQDIFIKEFNNKCEKQYRNSNLNQYIIIPKQNTLDIDHWEGIYPIELEIGNFIPPNIEAGFDFNN